MTPSGVRRVERILKVFRAESGANVTAVSIDEDKRPQSPSLLSVNATFFNETDTSSNDNTTLNEP